MNNVNFILKYSIFWNCGFFLKRCSTINHIFYYFYQFNYISDKIQLKITMKFNFVKNYQSGKKSHFMRYTLYTKKNSFANPCP